MVQAHVVHMHSTVQSDPDGAALAVHAKCTF